MQNPKPKNAGQEENAEQEADPVRTSGSESPPIANEGEREAWDESILLPEERRQPVGRRRPLGPMSIAFLLLAAGGLLTILLPPVGLVIMLTGLLVFLWGVFSASRSQ